LVLAALPGTLLAADAEQHEARILNDKFGIGLGGYLVDFRTDASAGFGAALGTVIRLEDDLAMDDSKSTFRLGGFYRFRPRHALSFGYFALDRPGTTVIEEQIEFNGVVYDVGAQVDSQFDVALFQVDYRYSFVNTGKTEAGFAAGLSAYSFDMLLDGEATIVEGRQVTERVREEESFLAPVPTVGMFINHAITPNWILRMRAQFLDLDVGDFTGRLVDTSVTFDYYFTRNFGIGFGGNTTDIRYEDTSDDPFTVDYRQSGLVWYVIGVL
jgi:hypothetical protein